MAQQAQQRRMEAETDPTKPAYAATDAALQQISSATIALSRSLDPGRSARRRAEDLRSARAHLSAAIEAIGDGIGALA